MLRAALAVLLALAVGSPAARAASFADADARVFTLVPDGTVSAVAALSSGDVVYSLRGEGSAPGRLMRMSTGGVVREVRADGAYLLSPESSHTVLRVREPRPGHPSVHRVERVDVITGAITKLPELPGDWSGDFGMSDIDAITVLDGGIVVAATSQGVYAITPKRARRVAQWMYGGIQPGGLAPLLGRRFAYVQSGSLRAGDLSGKKWPLAAGPTVGAITASGDGGVLATFAQQQGDADGRHLSMVRVGEDGTVTQLLEPADRPFDALGNGDGLALFQDELPLGGGGFQSGGLAVASDGTLLLGDDPGYGRRGHGLRAVVPPDSPRPRIALTQDAFTTFADGRIRFTATPGTVTVAGQVGATQVFDGRGDAQLGEVRIDPLPAPGRYALRLRLTTPSGGAETLAYIDTRPLLPTNEARSALTSAYAYSDGDEGGSFGTELGKCHRDGPRTVRCLLLSFVHSYAFDGPELGRRSHFQTPAAWVVATLLNDGVHTARQWLPGGEDGAEPCLRVSVKRHQRARNRGRAHADEVQRARASNRSPALADWHARAPSTHCHTRPHNECRRDLASRASAAAAGRSRHEGTARPERSDRRGRNPHDAVRPDPGVARHPDLHRRYALTHNRAALPRRTWAPRRAVGA